MNQTKKRLSIINLAISITDIETIQLQILQLGPLRTDEKIQEIIHALKAENYIQAQGLITTYIEIPSNEILQRTFQKEKENRKAQDNNTIDEFNLFTSEEENTNNNELRTLDFEDMLTFSNDIIEKKPKKVEKNIDFDSLLNMDKNDILPNNITLDKNHTSSNTFWDEPKKPEMNTSNIPKDTFFDVADNLIVDSLEEYMPTEKSPAEVSEEKILKQPSNKKNIEYEEINIDEFIVKDLNKEEVTEEPLETQYKEHLSQKEEAREKSREKESQAQEHTAITKNKSYKAIPYIDQKFKNMHVQYPPVQETLEIFPSVNAWLEKISREGYSEENIEEMIHKIDSLGTEHKEEAAQLLLITAATESKYAQFRLARRLYKGDIIQKNLAESFTLINRLACNDDYPEAICDLAQFYENGIGIDKNMKKAEILYKEAMDLGIKRATVHYERIKKQNSGLFSFLKK